MTLDLATLWDFDDPAGTEARFREALATAEGDDALVIRTQIARTHGLRGDPGHAREVLAGVLPALGAAGPEPVARYWLELGRTWISAVTTPDERTPEALAAAREAYARALVTAQAGGLDGLAVDAIHMLAFVDTAPEDQLAWNDRGLAIALASAQPAARRWEASLRNNRGMALHGLGRDEEALDEFRKALALREAQDDAGSTRIAWWMVAWALRLLGRLEEARDIQLRLEREWAAAHQPDPYVLEELEHLFRALGDEERAAHYAALRAAEG
jgi:tetratricopeptide (TPR) repeat protein